MKNIPQYILNVLNILLKNGFEAYLVGGCVRDCLMGIEPHDFDLTTNALPQEIIACFSDMKIIETGLKHGTVTVVSDGENVEITTYRIDGKYLDNRHPKEVLFTRNIHEDLSRRDFTSNAIAYSPKDGYIDIFGGMDDIKNKIIRCVGCPDKRFNEDGLRLMRAIRFSSVLEFEIEKNTAESIHSNAHLLKNISAERIYSELKKLLCGNNAPYVLKEYFDIFKVVFPALASYEQQFFKNIEYLNLLPKNYIVRFVAMFYNIDIDDIKSSLRLLKPDNNMYSNVVLLSDYIKRDIKTDEISVKYIMNKLSDENISMLADLKEIIFPEFNSTEFLSVYNNLKEKNVCVSIKQLEITGSDILSLGAENGPQIGNLLNELLVEVIETRLENRHDALINRVKNIMQK